MKTWKDNRRVGKFCIILSALIFTLSLICESAAEAYRPEMTAIPVTTKTGSATIVPSSPLFLFCMTLSSRLFSIAIVTTSVGFLLMERAKMAHRVEALETELQSLRAMAVR